MSVEEEPEYLDVDGVAHRIGVKRKSIFRYVERKEIPEPDLVWLGVKLWTPNTIDQWRAMKSMPRHKRPMIVRQDHEPPGSGRPPRLAKAVRARTALPKGKKDKRTSRKSSSVGALRKPAVSSVSAEQAGEIAARLRSEGDYCTTADVMVLADADPEGLEHERVQLQRRVHKLLRKTGWVPKSEALE